MNNTEDLEQSIDIIKEHYHREKIKQELLTKEIDDLEKEIEASRDRQIHLEKSWNYFI